MSNPRTDYLLELIAGEFQKELLIGTAALTDLDDVAGVVFRDSGATFATLEVDGEDALSGMFRDLDNTVSLSVTDGVLFAGKDKKFTAITLSSATDSIWLIKTRDD